MHDVFKQQGRYSGGGGEGRFRTSVDARNCGCSNPPCGGINYNDIIRVLGNITLSSVEIVAGLKLLAAPLPIGKAKGAILVVDGSSKLLLAATRGIVTLFPQLGLKYSDIPGNPIEAAFLLYETVSGTNADPTLKQVASVIYNTALLLTSFRDKVTKLDEAALRGELVFQIEELFKPYYQLKQVYE